MHTSPPVVPLTVIVTVIVTAAPALAFPTRTDRLLAVPDIASLLFSNMPPEEDAGVPPGVTAVGRRADVLRVTWGGCGRGGIAYFFVPIEELPERLRTLGFRALECADAPGHVRSVWRLTDPAPTLLDPTPTRRR